MQRLLLTFNEIVMRKIALLFGMFMPAFCLAYYGEEKETSGFVVLYGIIGFIYFILTIVAIFKIIGISKNVNEIKERIGDNENPYYFYLMGDKEKAKEIMTKQMVRDLENKWSKDESFSYYYWKKEFDRIECEIPDILKDVKSISHYEKLFGKKKEKE